MKKYLFLVLMVFVMLMILRGCSTSDDYCCVSNSECGPVRGKGTACNTKECGKCVDVEPIEISIDDWKDASVGRSFTSKFTAIGGILPYTWEFASGDLDKLGWLTLTWEGENNETARFRSRDGEYPSNPTTGDGIPLTITVKDDTRHVNDIHLDNQAVSKTLNLRIINVVADPIFVPLPGSYGTSLTVEISCATVGAAIFFTLDNSDPTTLSTIYSLSIPLTGPDKIWTIKAMATKNGMISSNVVKGAYTISTALKPLGSSCTVDDECSSSHCANKVCCDTACDIVCQACSTEGQCNMTPADDSRCGTIDCSGLNTTCRTYLGLTTNRCVSFGVCKHSNSPSCTGFSKNTGALCRASTDEWCDPAEYCDSNGDCPADVKTADRVSCGTGNCAACYNGSCQSDETLCGTCMYCSGSGPTSVCAYTIKNTQGKNCTKSVSFENQACDGMGNCKLGINASCSVPILSLNPDDSLCSSGNCELDWDILEYLCSPYNCVCVFYKRATKDCSGILYSSTTKTTDEPDCPGPNYKCSTNGCEPK